MTSPRGPDDPEPDASAAARATADVLGESTAPTGADAGPGGGADEPAGVAPAAAAVFACPGCGHDVAADVLPAGGLLGCPACGAEFFATAEASDEDQAEAERLAVDQQVRGDRLVDLRRNVVLLERRSLFRTRSYVVVAAGVCVVVALQLTVFAAQRWVFHGLGPRVATYLVTIGAMLALAWLSLGKIRDLNDEIAKPAQRDPAEPPDFSTLSDGSQVLDAAARNLERLAGGPGAQS